MKLIGRKSLVVLIDSRWRYALLSILCAMMVISNDSYNVITVAMGEQQHLCVTSFTCLSLRGFFDVKKCTMKKMV